MKLNEAVAWAKEKGYSDAVIRRALAMVLLEKMSGDTGTAAEPEAEPETDWHMHKCPNPHCRTVWAHDMIAIPEGKYEEAHECPACGTSQKWRYFGQRLASYCWEGTRKIIRLCDRSTA